MGKEGNRMKNIHVKLSGMAVHALPRKDGMVVQRYGV